MSAFLGMAFAVLFSLFMLFGIVVMAYRFLIGTANVATKIASAFRQDRASTNQANQGRSNFDRERVVEDLARHASREQRERAAAQIVAAARERWWDVLKVTPAASIADARVSHQAQRLSLARETTFTAEVLRACLDAAFDEMQRQRAEQEKQGRAREGDNRSQPESDRNTWWGILGVAKSEPLSVVEAVYRAKAKIVHPDGPQPNADHMTRLNGAITEARRKLPKERAPESQGRSDTGRRAKANPSASPGRQPASESHAAKPETEKGKRPSANPAASNDRKAAGESRAPKPDDDAVIQREWATHSAAMLARAKFRWWHHFGGNRSRSLEELQRLYDAAVSRLSTEGTPRSKIERQLLDAAWEAAREEVRAPAASVSRDVGTASAADTAEVRKAEIPVVRKKGIRAVDAGGAADLSEARALEEANSARRRGDFAFALVVFRAIANQGHAGAQYSLGDMYSKGEGVPQDYGEAVKWCRKAAEQGHAKAQDALGDMYGVGLGVPQNLVESFEWYRKAADQGDASAQYWLGWRYRNHQEYAQAVKWFTKAAEQGHADAQQRLGWSYHKGEGVPVDYGEAFKWFTKAAEQEQVHAQACLGRMYSNGDGIPKDQAEAIKWFTKAAEQGSDEAQYSLGRMCALGQGMPMDDNKAMEWFNMAAEKGNTDALYCYQLWLAKADDQVHAAAQYDFNLGYDPVRSDPQYYGKAMKRLRKAADEGDASAQYSLGDMYAVGRGSRVDYVQAYKWFSLAAALFADDEKEERDEARLIRDRVAATMTREQVARARRLAGEWKPKAAK